MCRLVHRNLCSVYTPSTKNTSYITDRVCELDCGCSLFGGAVNPIISLRILSTSDHCSPRGTSPHFIISLNRDIIPHHQRLPTPSETSPPRQKVKQSKDLQAKPLWLAGLVLLHTKCSASANLISWEPQDAPGCPSCPQLVLVLVLQCSVVQ